MRLKGKVAVVTGSGSGLGKAIAMRFAQEGAVAIIADINEDALAATVREIEAAGGKARGYRVDVTDRAGLHAFVEQLVAAEGRIDILVNNAGTTRYRAFDATADVDWDAVLGLDLKGGVFKQTSAKKIAASLKRSAEHSSRRKSGAYRSALSMLTFYINRAGKTLPKTQRARLERAKVDLKHQFGRE